MSFTRYAGMLPAVSLLLAGAAYADAPVELSEAQVESLDAGGRVRVIVSLEDVSIPLEAAAMSDHAREQRSDAIRAAQDMAVSAAFGENLSTLETRRDAYFAGIAEDRPGAELTRSPRLAHSYRYTPALAMVLDRAEIEALADAPGVRRISEDLITHTMMDESLTLVGATILHDLGFTGEGYAVAVIDTGTDHDHPMLADSIVASACFSTPDPAENQTSRCPTGLAVEIGGRAGDDCDRCEVVATHGTHVGGTVAGRPVTANIDGADRLLRGVAPGAGMVAVNAFFTDVNDNAAYSRTSDQLAALEWLYDNRMVPNPGEGDPLPLAAVNMSLGGGYTEDYCNENPLSPIISMLHSAGVATVIASGNERRNEGLSYPACIQQAITVGATTRDDQVAFFSNSHFAVDLLAPGVGIRSAVDMEGSTPVYDAYNGTSMATPHVAGAIALLRSAVPQASLAQIELALQATGRPVTDTDNDLTRPRIQLNLAYQALVEMTQEIGPVTVFPTTDYFSTVDVNRPEQPDTVTYALANHGASDVDVTVTVTGNDAITFGEGLRSFTVSLAPDNGVSFGIEIDLAAVRLGTTTGQIRIAVSHDGGEQIIPIRATVLGYAGALPTERPHNDNFSQAIRVADGQLTIQASTFGATTQLGEPDHDGEDNGGSIWYAIESVRDAELQIDVSGRLGQTSVGVYRGNSLVALQSMASASATGGPVSVQFEPEEGETYYLAVDYNPTGNTAGAGERDPFSIVISPLAGDLDAFATPMELTGSDVGFVSFAGSTVEEGEPFPPSNGVGTLWLRATGNPGDTLEFGIVSTSNNVVFTVFDGDTLATLEDVANGFGGTTGFNETETATIPADGNLFIRMSPATFGSDSTNRTETIFRYAIGTGENSARIVSAVGPQFRTVRPNQFTSALVSASAAASGADGVECGVLPPLAYPGIFRFMPLTPETGGAGDAVDIASGTNQVFAFGTQRDAVTNSNSIAEQLAIVPVTVTCENGAAGEQTALNSLYLTVSELELADIVASTALTTGNALELDQDGSARFAVAAANLSSFSGPVIVVPVSVDNNYFETPPGAIHEVALVGESLFPALPLTLEICETDPATGQCFSDFATSERLSNFAPNTTRTFTVRVTGQGDAVAFDPARNRIYVGFVQVENLDIQENRVTRIVGGGSVAVRTTPQD